MRAAALTGVVGSLAALAVASTLSLWAVNRLAEQEAEREAFSYGEVAARVALGPFVTDSAISGSSDDMRALAEASRLFIAQSGAVRLKIWTADGVVLWSDDTRIIGQRFALEPEEQAVLDGGTSVVEISRLGKQENEFDRLDSDRLLEVYLGSQTNSGQKVLIETYFSYSLVSNRIHSLRARLLPLTLGGLILLATIQLPLSLALARRLARSQREREHLLQRMIAASDIERRRIAAAVHDRAVQDLIGVSYSLTAEADRAPAPLSSRLHGLAGSTRTTIRSLRSLLNSIYPIEVPTSGWIDGIEDLLTLLDRQGVEVVIKVAPISLTPMSELLLLRVAREALRNASAHAQPAHVWIQLEQIADRVLLEIRDDGRGFSTEEATSNRRSGHLGLQLLRDLTSDSGDILFVDSTPGSGTTVRLELTGHQ